MANEESLELQELQKETIETLKEYLSSLIPCMENVIDEFRGILKEDSWEYLRMLIDGFNWTVEAFNGTMDIINKDGAIDVKAVDAGVASFTDAYKAKDAAKVADAIEGHVIPFLKQVDAAI